MTSPDTILVVIIFGGLLLTLFAFFLILYVAIQKRKQYRHILEKQKLEHDYQSQLLQSKLEVQEQSFRNFSEEIHDNVGQLLSLTKMQLHNISNRSTEPGIVKLATESAELMGKAIGDLRNISHTLNSSFIARAGLRDSIEKELGYIRSARGIECHLHNSGDDFALGNEKELLIFRVIQEAIANALKHASPTHLDVYLTYTPDELAVKIQDNGKGFDVALVNSGGIGLNNMQVRAQLLKGKLDISSAEDRGTTISLVINKNEFTPTI